MSSSTASPIRSVLNAVDSSPESPEEKSSNLRSSDIPFIKEKGGMSDEFEVVIPGPEERAHLTPRGQETGTGEVLLSHKGDHAFIKGNPSSHKGWMSRFFFVRRVGKRRDPWRCDMSWRDNMYNFTPSTPERSPNLTTFLADVSMMCFHAPELIKEDILCLFGFSRKGVELVGDLDERMGKAAMLKALEEEEAGASGAAVHPEKVAKKRRASTPAEKEARRQRKKTGASTSGAREGGRAPTPPTQTLEELPKLPPVITIAEASSPSKKKGPGRVPPLDMFEDSLVVSPSGAVATRYLCHMASDRDLDRLGGATDSEAVITSPPNSHRAQDKRAATTEKEALEAQLAAERVARAAEEETIRSELYSALAKKTAVEVELEEAKARAEEEARRLRNEAINAWDLSKEEFLQSSEFETLCAKKVLGYFKVGFSGCLAQFRANGYSEEEHPTSFLDFKKALADMADAEEAEEEEEEEEEEEDEADVTSPSSPKP
ncbi:cold shock domain-containing protein 3-like [Dorcoceras hygrometricum]|uniref:Cold shock domain-containing protein 3-like n=1 Tax=Dorcoceras hygrometricum TaxID=472368 RepID=A0A2Z7C702_9LAMI|nr:cold shock domain-containing protein 3-like [Dorcoceras hygrometricum]